MLSSEAWATIGIFVVTQAATLIWILATTTNSARVLSKRMDAVQEELKSFGSILVTLADFKGEMKLTQERIMMQGKRLDDLTSRFNDWLDPIVRNRP